MTRFVTAGTLGIKWLETNPVGTMAQNRRLLTLSPGRIAGGYLVVGVIWILLSDRVVLLITESPTEFAQIQTIKGWLFVGGSAALIFGLTQTREHQIKSSQDRLNRATQELQVLHRVFRHNIRNDLNVIQGYIDMALDAIDDNRVTEWLHTATVSTRRITDMSEKLRIIERTDIDTLHGDSVDIVQVIRPEVEEFESAYPNATFETDLPERARILGDQAMRYVIRELLENAIEHHHLPEGQRHISISAYRSMTSVTIQISDNGPGIPDDELRALTSGAETQLTHMSGVGLWIVKWLCGFSGGHVSFKSEAGKGTLATIECQAASPIEGLADRALTEVQAQASA